MSGEDVYDLAVWCRICDQPHMSCEFEDLDYRCIVCDSVLKNQDDDQTYFCDDCRPAEIPHG